MNKRKNTGVTLFTMQEYNIGNHTKLNGETRPNLINTPLVESKIQGETLYIYSDPSKNDCNESKGLPTFSIWFRVQIIHRLGWICLLPLHSNTVVVSKRISPRPLSFTIRPVRFSTKVRQVD
ncbi:hypothetical protein HUJ05_001290 [Dendroctonus ponderosae]|nr:hypothetical protein HUJ05_001290 [Dendroctonus ponderosae]